MELSTKWHVIIILAAMAFLIALIIIFAATRKPEVEYPLETIQADLEECNTLVYNGESAINLVMFGERKTSQDYIDFFYQTPPFNEHKDKFNFYYIDSYEPECELYKNIAILCYTRENIEKAASCPNDFIIVLKEDVEKRLRSSAYINLASINTQHAFTVLTHELGHVFINAAEEYVPASIPRGALNCPTNCDDFEGLNLGCFTGCSESNHIRSIENGVMRTLRSNDYGPFNLKLMNDFILESIEELGGRDVILQPQKSAQSPTITGNQILELAREAKYSIIDIDQETGSVKETVRLGYAPRIRGKHGSYTIKTLSESGEILSTGTFNPFIFNEEDNTITGAEEITGSVDEVEEVITLTIPTAEEPQELQLLDGDGNEIVKTTLYGGAKLCEV